ncbi:type II secretion system F family protein [Gordonia aurantiaca]|uniref:type II secretion system F family protein n=1 Tax=Gordonia sp. B21 TaxID=3151852 RepID=UPI003264C001
MTTGVPPAVPMLAALGVAVLLWSPPRAVDRVRGLFVERVGHRSIDPAGVIVVVVPGLALSVGGVGLALASGIVVAVVVWLRRRRASERRFERRLDDLLMALSLMIAEMSVGTPPVHACGVAALELRRRETGGDGSEIADGLEAMASRASLGGAAIEVMGPGEGPDRSGGSDVASWRRIGIAWQTAEQYGLPMVDMLTALRSDLSARRGFVDRTRAGLSGPRATAMVLAGLPLLGIALGQATGAGPLQVLLGGGFGGLLLVIGTALAAAGVVWSERITGKVLTR